MEKQDTKFCPDYPNCKKTGSCQDIHPDTPEEREQWRLYQNQNATPGQPRFLSDADDRRNPETFKKFCKQTQQNTGPLDFNQQKLKEYEEELKKPDQDLIPSKFEEQKIAIQEHLSVDLLLILDCTSSMSSWIKQCQKNLDKIIDEVRQKANVTQKIRVAYLGYRDFGNPGDEKHFDLLDYTEDIQKVKDKIKKSKAMGGGDIPEDVTGALERALEFKREADLQLIYLVCDAPAHGRQYHDVRYDDFPDVPEGALENVMTEIKNKKILNNSVPTTFFTAFKINDSTDKMFAKMESSFGHGFSVTDQHLADGFLNTMVRSMLDSIEKTRTKTNSPNFDAKQPQSSVNRDDKSVNQFETTNF